MTQIDMIKQHFVDFGELTSLEAIREYGCTRLAAVVWKLIRRGWKFEKVLETSKNRYGHTVTYTRYIYMGTSVDNPEM